MSTAQTIVHGNCLDWLNATDRRFDLIVADPPYNIGIDYGETHNDTMSHAEYETMLRNFIERAIRRLTPTGSFYLVINDEWAAEAAMFLKLLWLMPVNWIKWYETFGVNCQGKFSRTSRHILHFAKDYKTRTWNPDAIRVPSDRQVKYRDKRADPRGKVPDDVWTFPRVCGTHKERVKGFPTQLPLALVERMILASSNTGDWVLDPFSGSGTTMVACAKHGRNGIGVDINEEYVRLSRERLASA